MAEVGDEKMREALGDVAEMRVIFTGRNGFETTFRYPVNEFERGRAEGETTLERQEYGVLGQIAPYREPLPYRRRFTWSLQTKIR